MANENEIVQRAAQVRVRAHFRASHLLRDIQFVFIAHTTAKCTFKRKRVNDEKESKKTQAQIHTQGHGQTKIVFIFGKYLVRNTNAYCYYYCFHWRLNIYKFHFILVAAVRVATIRFFFFLLFSCILLLWIVPFVLLLLLLLGEIASTYMDADVCISDSAIAAARKNNRIEQFSRCGRPLHEIAFFRRFVVHYSNEANTFPYTWSLVRG